MDQQLRFATFPLSPGQAGIWVSHYGWKLSTACQSAQVTEISAAIDPRIFAVAAAAVVAETETLCLRFVAGPDGPEQWIDPAIAAGEIVTFHDLSGQADPVEASQHVVRTIIERPIEPIGEQKLFGWHLIKLTSRKFLWVQIYHHLIADATTRMLLLARMAEAYVGRPGADGEPSPAGSILADILNDADYRPGSRAWCEDRAYWLSLLADRPKMPSLSGRNTAARGVSSRRQSRLLAAASHQALRDLAHRLETTLPAMLAACVGFYVGRICGQRDILLGWMTSGRLGRASRPVAAMLANRVVLRFSVDPSQSLADLSRAVRRQTRMALRHQRFPHEVLRRELGLAPGGDELCATVLNHLHDDGVTNFAGEPCWTRNVSRGPVEDLVIAVAETQGGDLQLDFDGNIDRYAPADLAAHADRLLRLLEHFARSNGETLLAAIGLPGPAGAAAANRAFDTGMGMGTRARPDEPQTDELRIDKPQTGVEVELCALFAELTGHSQVSVNDDFFAIGGHSLLALRLLAKLRQTAGPELDLHTIFRHPTPAALASALKRRDRRPGATLDLSPADQQDAPLSLTSGQLSLWLMDRIEGPSAAYNIPLAVRLEGDIDDDAMAQALADLVDRHVALRIAIEASDGMPRGRVRPPPPPSDLLSIENLAGSAPADADQRDDDTRLSARLAAEIARNFDLGANAFLRALLLHLAPRAHVLLLVVHHCAADGSSLPVLIGDLSIAYAARRQGRPPAFVPLPLGFTAYTAARECWLTESGEGTRQLAYWRGQLAGAPDHLALPTDQARRPERSRRAGHLPVELSAERAGRVNAMALAMGTTPFAVLLAGFAAMLGRVTGQDDVVIGTSVAGRDRPELDALVGCLVNTLALRLDLSHAPDSKTLVARARACVLDALAHQDVPFWRVVNALGRSRAVGETTLFQVMLTWNTQKAAGLPDFPGLVAAKLSTVTAQAKYDLFLALRPTPAGTITGALEYDADLFAPETVMRWLDFWHRLVDGIAGAAEGPVARLPLLDDREYAQLVTRFNQTARPMSAETVPMLFAAQVARRPAAAAIVYGEDSLSYAELDARSNRLARYLIGCGVGPETCVALAIPRSAEMVIGLVAVLKAGAAYLPLDLAAPPARLRLMLADARAAFLLITQADPAGVSGMIPTLRLDDPALQMRLAALPGDPISDAERSCALTADNLAYIIYTSGSTGRPKAVATTHGNVVSLALKPSYRPIGPDDTILQFAPLAFDAATFEIWGALLNGARLVIAPAGPPDLDMLAQLIAEHRVNTLWLTASLLPHVMALQPQLLNGVQWLLTGGEAVSASAAGQAMSRFPQLDVINGYGPTETTTFATTHHITAADVAGGNLPIGKPIGNTSAFILDACLSPVPVGVTGELYIAGAGLARGYLGRPGLTAERFIACPFGPPGARMYRTGDLARWRSDGTIAYLGRADQQIKIRGFRVEPGEIEAALLRIDGIAQAAVTTCESAGLASLVAYLVPAEDRPVPPAAALRGALRDILPHYMVPASFVTVDHIPLTPNGKRDLRGLAAMRPATALTETDTTPDAVEAALGALWHNVLASQFLHRDADLFALGASSLDALRVAAKISQHFAVAFPASQIFLRPSIAGQAELIRNRQRLQGSGGAALIQGDRFELTEVRAANPAAISRGRVLCLPLLGGGAHYAGRIAAEVLQDYDVWSCSFDLQGDEDPNSNSWIDCTESLARWLLNDAAFRPVAFLGFSIGGYVGWLLDRLLVAGGWRATKVINLDGGCVPLAYTGVAARLREKLPADPAAPRAQMLLLYRHSFGTFFSPVNPAHDWSNMDCDVTPIPCRTIRHLDFLDAETIRVHHQQIKDFLSDTATDSGLFRQAPCLGTAGGRLFDLLDRGLTPSADELRAFLVALPDGPIDPDFELALLFLTLACGDVSLAFATARRSAAERADHRNAYYAQVALLSELRRVTEAVEVAQAWCAGRADDPVMRKRAEGRIEPYLKWEQRLGLFLSGARMELALDVAAARGAGRL